MVNIREWMRGSSKEPANSLQRQKENDNANNRNLKPQLSQQSQQSQQPQTPQSRPQQQQPQPQQLLKKLTLFGRNTKKQPEQPKPPQTPQLQPQVPQQQQQPPVALSVSQQNLNKQKSDVKPSEPQVSINKNYIRCQITYLDETIKYFDVDKAALGQHLYNLVCTDLELIEKDYFSLTFRDSNNMKFWLDHEKKIKTQLKGVVAVVQPVFNFEVKYYPPEPSLLQEEITRYLLTLQLRHDIMDGKLPCSFVTHALLGSYSVQAELGDYDKDIHGVGYAYLEGFYFAPQQTTQLLEAVAEYHKDHKGQSPAEAEMHFLENSVKLAMYGVDLHNGKDSDGVDILLGVSASGLMVYRDHLRINRFSWPKILKISYKRNYFYLKLRAGEFEKYESTIGFRCPNHKAAKRLWKIAVEHHAFFRLREPEKPKKQMLPSFNQRFRYTGQSTYIQTRYRSVERQQPAFERSLSKRLTQSMDRGLASSTFQRPNISSKSIPDKINLTDDDEDEYVTDEMGRLPQLDSNGDFDRPGNSRLAGPLGITSTLDASSGVVGPNSMTNRKSITTPNLQQGSGRVPPEGTYSTPNKQVDGKSVASTPTLTSQDRRYVQPPFHQQDSQQRTPRADRQSLDDNRVQIGQPLQPSVEQLQDRRYMPQYEQPQQAEQQLPFIKQYEEAPQGGVYRQPSVPTTPQDPRRYVEPSSVLTKLASQPGTPKDRQYVQQFEQPEQPQQLSQYNKPTTPPNRRYSGQHDPQQEIYNRPNVLQQQQQQQPQFDRRLVPEPPQHQQYEYEQGNYKRPSVPTTPQGRRFEYEPQQDEPFYNKPITPQDSRRNVAQYEEPGVYRQPSIPTTPQQDTRRHVQPQPQQQQYEEPVTSVNSRQPSQPTTPQSRKYQPAFEDQQATTAFKPPSIPTTPQNRRFQGAPEYEQENDETQFNKPSTPQDRRYVQQQSPGTPLKPSTPQERRNIEQDQRYRSSDDEEKSVSSATRNISSLIAGLKRDSVDNRAGGRPPQPPAPLAEPARPPPPRSELSQPQRPPPPPPHPSSSQPSQSEYDGNYRQRRPTEPLFGNLEQQPQQLREQYFSKSSSSTNIRQQEAQVETTRTTTTIAGATEQQSNVYVEKTIVLNTEANHQDVLLRAIQIATALDPSLEVEKVEISTE